MPETRNKLVKFLLSPILLAVVFFAVSAFSASASLPSLVSFRGKVSNSDGTSVTGNNYNMSFGLYSAITGGTALWSEDLTAATRFGATIESAAEGADSITYTYSGASNEATLRIGQYLSAGSNSALFATIIGYDTTANTLTVTNENAAWAAAETINNRPRVYQSIIEEYLGTVTSLSAVNFNQPLYLEITFNAETLSPRKVITPEAQALNADKLDNLDSTDFLRSTGGGTVSTSSASTTLTVTQNGAGNIVDLYSGADKVLTVLANGNVGIGTSSPSARLSVTGATAQTSPLFMVDYSASGTATSSALYINSSGNVGIGTTNPGTTKLTINQEATAWGLDINAFSGASTFAIHRANGTAASPTKTLSGDMLGAISVFGHSGSSYFGGPSARIAFYATADGDIGRATDITFFTAQTINQYERMRITSVGNVGIGTTTPGAGLHVLKTTEQLRLSYDSSNYSSFTVGNTGALTLTPSNGTFNLQGSSGTTAFNIKQTASALNVLSVIPISDVGSWLQMYSTDSGSAVETIRLSSYGSSFLNGGNVGIGTTSPGQKLEVNGSIYINGSATDKLILNGNTGDRIRLYGNSTDYAIGIEAPGIVYYNAVNTHQFKIGGVEKVRIDNSGNVGIGTTSPGALLDIYGAGNVLRLPQQNTPAAPTLAFGDRDTGLYELLDDNLSVGIAGGRVLGIDVSRFEANTIGSFALSFSASATTTPTLIPNRNQVDTGIGGDENNLSLITNGSSRMVITDAGNVGIGTTNPVGLLHVKGASSGANLTVLTLDNTTNDNGATQVSMNFRVDDGRDRVQLVAGRINSSGYLGIKTRTTGDVLSEALRISAAGGLSLGNSYVATDPGAGSMIVSGNVGIGTTSPTQELSVSGDGFFSGTLGLRGASVDSTIGVNHSASITSGSGYGLYNTMTISGTIGAVETRRAVGVYNDLTDTMTTTGGAFSAYGIYNVLKTADNDNAVNGAQNVFGSYTELLTYDTEDKGYGSYITANIDSTAGNQYGIYINLFDPNTTNYGIYVASGGGDSVFGDTVKINDNVGLVIGTSDDFKIIYDETTDDRLELSDGTNNFLTIKDQGTTADFAFNTDDLFITNTGNVGIGTTSPTHKLEVLGDTYINGVLSAATTTTSYAQTITVAKSGADYITISAAYTYAKTLSPSITNQILIRVMPGVYAEQLTLDTNYISLAGAGNDVVTVTYDGDVITVNNAAVTNVTVSDFEFKTTSTSGKAGIAVTAGAPTFIRNKATDNGGSGAYGGLHVSGGTFIENIITTSNVGIWATGGTFIGNTINGNGTNQLYSITGVTMYYNSFTKSGTITSGTFVKNIFAGLNVAGGTFQDNVIDANIGSGTVGVTVTGGSPVFSGGMIKNSGGWYGVSITSSAATPTFKDLQILSGTSFDHGIDSGSFTPTIELWNVVVARAIDPDITVKGNYTISQNISTVSALTIKADSSQQIVSFGNSSTQMFNILSTGNVGIGITSPNYKLEVNGSASTTLLYMPNTFGASTGVIYKGTETFIHNFQHPTGNTAVPTGLNTFVGVRAGNLTMGSTATQAAHGSYNTALGYNALNALTTGYNNVAIGYTTMDSNTTGVHNVAVGNTVLTALVSGNYNTAIGDGAMVANISGVSNTAVGSGALNVLTTGSENVAVGSNALSSYNGGRGVAVGVYALQLTTGVQNVSVGPLSLQYNTSGTSNSALGYHAGLYNISATSTTLIGTYAGNGGANYNAGEITAVGAYSLNSIQTGAEDNTALGYKTGYNLTTGANNLLLGYQAGDNLTVGSNNIIIGYNIDATSTTMTRGLNIGNLIYATGLDGSGTTLSTGNVGIGTTNPTGALDIAGKYVFGSSAATTFTMSGLYNHTDLFLEAGSDNDAVVLFERTGSEKWSMGLPYSTSDDFYIGTSHASGNVMVLQRSSGNVGIGTTTPGALLHVDGNALFGAASPSTPTLNPINVSFGGTYGNQIPGTKTNLKWTMYDDSAALFKYGIGMSLNLMEFQAGTDGGFGFYPNGGTVSAMAINSTGNVGIGTTSPNAKLTVDGGDIRVTGGSFMDDGATLTVPDYVFEDDYQLMGLYDLDYYLSVNKHLPGLPDMADKAGWSKLSLQDRDMKLLEKIEENTLYIIGLDKKIEASAQEKLTARADEKGNIFLESAQQLTIEDLFDIDENGYVIVDKIRTKELSVEKGADAEKNMIGEGQIAIGLASTTVKNLNIENNSKIFITWRDDLSGADWWICEQKENQGFDVCVNTPTQKNLRFDYWIIGVAGDASSTPTELFIPPQVAGESIINPEAPASEQAEEEFNNPPDPDGSAGNEEIAPVEEEKESAAPDAIESSTAENESDMIEENSAGSSSENSSAADPESGTIMPTENPALPEDNPPAEI